MSNDDDKPSYDVGYGKPPREHRFPKGTSGNAGGRPSRPVRALSKRQLLLDPIKPAEQMVKVRRRGKVVEIPLIEAVWESVAAKAASGHAPSQRFFIKHHAQAIDQLYKHYPEYLRALDRIHDDAVSGATGENSAAEQEQLNHFRRRSHQLVGQYDSRKDPFLKKQKRQQAAAIARDREREKKGIRAANVQVLDTGIAVHDPIDGRRLVMDRSSQAALHQALGVHGRASFAELATGLSIGRFSYDETVDLLRRGGVAFKEDLER